MPEHRTQTCDICGADITERKKRCGMTVVVGYSMNGWGHRENHIEWSGEICHDCHNMIAPNVVERFNDLRTMRAEQMAPTPLPPARAHRFSASNPLLRRFASLWEAWKASR